MIPKPDEGVTLPPLDWKSAALIQRESQLLSTLQQLETAKGLLMELRQANKMQWLDDLGRAVVEICRKLDASNLLTDRKGRLRWN